MGVLPQSREVVVREGGIRLDRWLAGQMPDLSRSRIQALIREGHVRVNGGPAKASYTVRPGDRVLVVVPPPQPSALVPRPLPLAIVYEDDDLLVVDKPPGMPVHPGPGHRDDTLVNALLGRGGSLSGIGGVLRPGIVHRLDKDTSGLLLVAKNDAAHQGLAQQIRGRLLQKGYLALVWGVPAPPEGVIDAPIARSPRDRRRMAVVPGGRPARTRYRVLRVFPRCALVEVFPETGRTHQVRVHMQSIGHPLVGDPLYSRRRTPLLGRQFLHAHLLRFTHPRTGEAMAFHSPLPPDLQGVVEALERGESLEG
jgi:23S rRNA pseudouridine1911/1915/1917 synthase